MASPDYGLDMDNIATKLDSLRHAFDSVKHQQNLYDPMAGQGDHVAHMYDAADMHMNEADMYMHGEDLYGEDMYMEGDEDMYMDPISMYAHLSDEEREELLRQYQYYQQKAAEEQQGQYAEEYGYYDDEDYGYYGDEYEYYDDEYANQRYYDNEYTRITLSELCDRCVLPTLAQAVSTLYPLLALCLFSRLLFLTTSEVCGNVLGSWSRSIQHAASAVCGLIALYFFFEETLIYGVTLAGLAYALLHLTRLKCTSWSGIAVSVVTVVYLVTCELFVVQKVEWHRIRGAQMVLSMKIISLAFDLDAKTVLQLPGPLEYFGYVFNVGTVIFGPWVSFIEYSNSLLYKDRKITFFWLLKCTLSFVCSLACVVISTCVVHWLFLDEEAFMWLLAYRDAQSFRFSHYFISYASELTATLAGLGASKQGNDVRWDLTVAKPFHIEFPRSLVEVVTNWNLPMHFWLKTYVFKSAKPLGNFAAIILTYAASALLHGLNFQLAAVLLSLGFYSYIEFVLRRWLSRVYDACIQAKACKDHCDHSHNHRHPYVVLLNIGLGCLAAFHLAYLGLMFDNSPDQQQGYQMSHTLGKWSYLGYASHWVALATYLFYLLI